MKKLALILITAIAITFAGCTPEPEPTFELTVTVEAPGTVEVTIGDKTRTIETKHGDGYNERTEPFDNLVSGTIIKLKAIEEGSINFKRWEYKQGGELPLFNDSFQMPNKDTEIVAIFSGSI